jgi:hypothetical protein
MSSANYRTQSGAIASGQSETPAALQQSSQHTPQVSSVGARPLGARNDDRPVIELLAQLMLIVGAALLYFLVRGLTESDVDSATAHAHDLLRVERWLHIDVEATVQRRVLERRWLVNASNWVYIWGHWPVIATALFWLHRSDRAAFMFVRNAIFASGAIGLVIYMTYPVAPPRLLDAGFVDTVTELSRSYRVLQPPALVNKYAAMPSLHVGWNLLIGMFLYRGATRWWLRAAGVLSPTLMFVAVVTTANHYVLDAVIGILVALIGLWIASRLRHISRPRIATRMMIRITSRRTPACAAPRAGSTPR